MSSSSLLRGRRFYCREWALGKLRRCLDARSVPGQPTGLLVMGGPGTGKTALCTEAVWPASEAGRVSGLAPRCLAWHFCQREAQGSTTVWRFVLGLVDQLKASSLLPPEYCSRLEESLAASSLDPLSCQKSPDDTFKRAVLDPLLALPPPAQTLMVLVDSMDVGYQGSRAGGRSRSIAELLAAHQHLLPSWLLLVCSVRRHNKTMCKMFSSFRKLCLDDLRRPDPVHDVQQYILCRLDNEAALRRQLTPDTADMLNLLHIKSGGCFLFLERVLDGVAAAVIGLREIRDIPGTLNGLYLWLCQRLFPRGLFGYVKPILNVILAAPMPLTPQQMFMALWTHDNLLSITEFQKKLATLSPLLIDGAEGSKLLFHGSFAEWLTDVKYCTQKYLCSRAEGHSMLAMVLTLRGPVLDFEETVQLGTHLIRSGHHQDEPSLLALWMIWAGVPALSSSSTLATSLTQAPVLTQQRVFQLLKDSGLVSAVNLPNTDSSLGVHYAREEANNVQQELVENCGLSINRLSSTDGQTLLATAALEGSANAVQFLLARGADPLISDHQGQTALTLASRLGHISVLHVLLDWARVQDAGAAVRMMEHIDNDGWTALRSAAWGGYSEAIRLLLDAGAEVDGCDTEGRTALRAASWGGHEETVLILLDSGAQVDKADCKGRTPLIAAAYMGHYEVVEVLLDHNAEVNLSDRDGRTALSVTALCVPTAAGVKGYCQVASLLLERGAEPGHRDHDGMTPLLLAAYEGHEEIVELLLDTGADVDETAGPDGAAPVAAAVTPLLAAAAMGHMKTVSLLLFWGAAVDAIDYEGRTALSLAAAQGNTEVVQALLDRGLDENHKDDLGWTPLHAAACEGHRAVCAVLTQQGSMARVGEMDIEGRTPLILAAQEGHLSAVRLLLDRRSPIDHRAYNGHSALSATLLEGHAEVAELLMRRGADTDVRDAEGRPILYLLVLEGRLDMAILLIEKGGVPMESQDSEGRTAVHVASWQGSVDMVDLLLKHGANPNAQDAEGRPPLHSVAWTGRLNIGRHLLAASGINIDLACHQGATALSIAAQEGHTDVVSMLLERGANPNHVDKYGRTPMKVARKRGHVHVIYLLEHFGAKPCPGVMPRTCIVSTAKANKISSLNISGYNGAEAVSSSPSSLGSNAERFHSTHSSQTSSTGCSMATTPTVPADSLSFIQQIQQHSLPRSRSRPSTLPPPGGSSAGSNRRPHKSSPPQTLCTVTAMVHHCELPPKDLSHGLDYKDRMNQQNLSRKTGAKTVNGDPARFPSKIQGPHHREDWDPPPKHNILSPAHLSFSLVSPSSALPGDMVSMKTSDPQLNLKQAIKLQFEGPTSAALYKRETPL